MATVSGRTVFVLGKRIHGNRQVIIQNDGEEYNLSTDAIVAYTNDTARFPYEI